MLYKETSKIFLTLPKKRVHLATTENHSLGRRTIIIMETGSKNRGQCLENAKDGVRSSRRVSRLQSIRPFFLGQSGRIGQPPRPAFVSRCVGIQYAPLIFVEQVFLAVTTRLGLNFKEAGILLDGANTIRAWHLS